MDLSREQATRRAWEIARDNDAARRLNGPVRTRWSSYRQYLKSPAWHATRARYFASKMPKECFVCGSMRVQLHHLTYERLGHEKLYDLMPLCERHHEMAHDFAETDPTLTIETAPEAVLNVYLKTDVIEVRRKQREREYVAKRKRVRKTKKRKKRKSGAVRRRVPNSTCANVKMGREEGLPWPPVTAGR